MRTMNEDEPQVAGKQQLPPSASRSAIASLEKLRIEATVKEILTPFMARLDQFLTAQETLTRVSNVVATHKQPETSRDALADTCDRNEVSATAVLRPEQEQNEGCSGETPADSQTAAAATDRTEVMRRIKLRSEAQASFTTYRRSEGVSSRFDLVETLVIKPIAIEQPGIDTLNKIETHSITKKLEEVQTLVSTTREIMCGLPASRQSTIKDQSLGTKAKEEQKRENAPHKDTPKDLTWAKRNRVQARGTPPLGGVKTRAQLKSLTTEPKTQLRRSDRVRTQRDGRQSTRTGKETVDEAIEDKLDRIVDEQGGISKRRSSTSAYLTLLRLVAIPKDGIRSNKDLSMILEVLLNTKSRSVLQAVVGRKGVQLMQEIAKHHMGNCKKAPVIRKLLKVLDFLASREILTLDQILGRSFKDMMSLLAGHKDRQVQKSARNFIQRWIPKSLRGSKGNGGNPLVIRPVPQEQEECPDKKSVVLRGYITRGRKRGRELEESSADEEKKRRNPRRVGKSPTSR